MDELFLDDCECGSRAEMMTSINYCWVQCTACPATGLHAPDYDTASIYWNHHCYQITPPSPPPEANSHNQPVRDGVGGSA